MTSSSPRPVIASPETDLFQVPDALRGEQVIESRDDLDRWGRSLLDFFTAHREKLTPFPEYFRVRHHEFHILTALLPDVYDLAQPHDVVLEIGCGFGFKALLLAPFARRVVGVDIPEPYHSHVVLEGLTSVGVARLLVNGGFDRQDVDFQEAWPDALPLEDASVDLIHTEYVLEHIPDLAAATREMWRVVRPGGRMVHVVPAATEAAEQLLRVNMRVPVRGLAKSVAAKLLRRRGYRGLSASANGTILPPCHSEFLDDFVEQFRVYSIENYVFPMIDAGFRMERVTKTREHNHVLVLTKPRPRDD